MHRRELLSLGAALGPLAMSGCARPDAAQAASAVADPDPLMSRSAQVLNAATRQYEYLLSHLRFSAKLPRTWVNGALKTVGIHDWTSGFFPGSLWLLFDHTQDAQWKARAQSYTRMLTPLCSFREHHDLGFMLGCSFGNGYRLTRDPVYRAVLLEGARTLASRFDERVGLIRSWDFGPWTYPVIIDNLMNLELLSWAAREGGDERLRSIAISHADQTLANFFRDDGGCFHLVDFDPASGRVLKRQTVQGAADASTWSRGYAWGLYGFTMLFRETRRPAYLAQARRMARFVSEHPRLPVDKVPYWDFDAPGIPSALRDSAAGAVMASALLELAALDDSTDASAHHALARQMLMTLCSPDFLAATGENGGFLLKHAVGAKPMNIEVDVPLVYADYYFLEALLRYRRGTTAGIERPS